MSYGYCKNTTLMVSESILCHYVFHNFVLRNNGFSGDNSTKSRLSRCFQGPCRALLHASSQVGPCCALCCLARYCVVPCHGCAVSRRMSYLGSAPSTVLLSCLVLSYLPYFSSTSLACSSLAFSYCVLPCLVLPCLY